MDQLPASDVTGTARCLRALRSARTFWSCDRSGHKVRRDHDEPRFLITVRGAEGASTGESAVPLPRLPIPFLPLFSCRSQLLSVSVLSPYRWGSAVERPSWSRAPGADGSTVAAGDPGASSVLCPISPVCDRVLSDPSVAVEVAVVARPIGW